MSDLIRMTSLPQLFLSIADLWLIIVCDFAELPISSIFYWKLLYNMRQTWRVEVYKPVVYCLKNVILSDNDLLNDIYWNINI